MARRKDDAPRPTPTPPALTVDARGLLQVPDADMRISLTLTSGRRDVRALPPMPRLLALRAPGSGLEEVDAPLLRHAFLDGGPNLVRVHAPTATHVHVSGCHNLRHLQTIVPASAVPVIDDLRARTARLFFAREQEQADAEAAGNFRRHASPRLTWPHTIVSAAGQRTLAVTNMMRGGVSIETGAALLCLAAEPERGVPDWWADYGPGDDGWINAMREWAECR